MCPKISPLSGTPSYSRWRVLVAYFQCFTFSLFEEEVDSTALTVEDGGVPNTAKYAKAVELLHC